jgi:uncharacterized protein YgiM (DUF1202 family)
MNRRILGIFLLLSAIMLLSACGGGATPAPTQAPTQPEPTEVEQPEEVETEAVVEEEETTAAEEEETEAAPEESATEQTEDEEAAANDETEAETTEGSEVEAVAEGTTVVVNSQNTTARSGPGTAFEVVGTLNVSDRLPVIARTESTGTALWYLVTLESGEPAWVWGRVVTLDPRDAEVEVAATVPSAP